MLDRWNPVIEEFKQGEFIDGDDFLKLCELYGVTVPIRTKGWAMEHLREIERGGAYKRFRDSTPSKSIKQIAVNLYDEILNTVAV